VYTIETYFALQIGHTRASGAIIIISNKVIIKAERAPGNRTEFFHRHHWLPTVLLVLLPFALHVPLWLLRRSSDPIWFVSGLTHGPFPLRWPFLDPNVGFTSEALGRLAAWDWLHRVVPWWNSYTGIGMPLAGELQPGAFFLPFSLLLGLSEGIVWQQITMQIIAGLATYLLLRELGLSRLAAWMGGSLFALNGTIAWTPGPATSYCSLPFLPLLLFGIEHARKQRHGAASILIIGVTTAWSILAGFPEPAYISALLVAAWGLYRLVSGPKRWMMARRAIAGFVMGMLVAAPLLIAFVDYMRQSDSLGIHNMGEGSIPWAAFSATLMPYVYGSLGTSLHSLALSQIWATIGGYTSILIILMATVGVACRSAPRGLKFILVAWILLAWAKTFGVPPVMGLMNHIPLMGQTIFFRYAPPSWELALIVLAAFGLDDFLNRTPDWRKPFGIAMGLLVIGIALALPQRAFWERPRAFVPFGFLLLGVSVGWVLVGMLAAGLSWKLLPSRQCRGALACLLVIDAAIMFMVPLSASMRGDQLDTAAVQFLRDHIGLSRFYSLGPIEPNYGAYFQVASINHNVEPVPKLWADYVEHSLLPGFSKIDLSETFWPVVMPDGEGERALSQHLANYLDVGVRYVVTKHGQSPFPTAFLPAKSGEQFITPERLQTLFAALDRLHSTADDHAKPAIERFLAKAILKVSNSYLGSARPADMGRGRESVATLDAEYVMLRSGQSVKIKVVAPSPLIADSPITSVGTMIGGSGAAVDGDLRVDICAGTVCQSGQHLLSGSADNAVLQIPLDNALAVPAEAPLRLTITHEDGSRPLALRLGTAAEQAQQIEGPSGAIPNHTLQLAFEYGMALSGSHRAYADSVMDIWELPNPAPYFQVVQGGPCTLLTMRREDVSAECVAPATLLRRELYMPGWRVTVNGKAAAAVQQNSIFQSAALPVGRSQVRYHFAPPYVEFGWDASLVGMAGLLWQLILIARSRQQRL
jgi:hypothetical protein